jgi:cyclic pyranopterin phosphate synthase
MPERMTFLPRAEVLSLEELHEVALAFIAIVWNLITGE